MLDDAGIIIVSGETYNDSVSVAMSKALITMGFKDVKNPSWGDHGLGRCGRTRRKHWNKHQLFLAPQHSEVYSKW